MRLLLAMLVVTVMSACGSSSSALAPTCTGGIMHMQLGNELRVHFEHLRR